MKPGSSLQQNKWYEELVFISVRKMNFDRFAAFLCTFDKPWMQWPKFSLVGQYKEHQTDSGYYYFK